MTVQSKEHTRYRRWLRRAYFRIEIRVMPWWLIKWLQRRASETAQY